MDFPMPSSSNLFSVSRPTSPMLDTSAFSFSTHLTDERSPSDNVSNVDEQHVPEEMETYTKYTPQTLAGSSGGDGTACDLSLSKEANCSMETDENAFNPINLPPPSQPVQKRKCILDLFPWLNDVTRFNQKCLGSIIDLKSTTVLDGMDSMIGKLTDDYHEYYKSPKLAVALARYVRQFLYVYRYLYQSFELGNEYFKRMARLLAIYTDLELCSSVLGLELDADTANRIQLVYRTHLEFADEAVVLDVFTNMKRLCRGHRGILNLILQYFLVKLTVQEPVELEDDLFIKYLIVFKKWLMVEEVLDDKENIRNAFITQVKPKKTLCMNISYAPYLPADEEGSATIDNYIRMLDKKYSLEPLIRALEISERNSMSYEELPSGIVRQISEVVILSDDEDETPVKSQMPIIKSEPLDTSLSKFRPQQSSMSSSADLIDLTDDTLDDTDVPRHYISWLADLVARAKIKPVTVDQRLEVAVISQDIIIIDDDDNIKPSTVDSNAINDGISKMVTHVDSPSSDSGCVIMNREEVGITQSNNNFDISRCSSDTGVDEEDVALNETLTRGVVASTQLHDTNGVETSAKSTTSKSPLTTTTTSHVSAGSNSSSCSEPAAEQLLLTVASVSHQKKPQQQQQQNVITVVDQRRLSYADTNAKTVRITSNIGTTRTVPDADHLAKESIQASTSSPNQTFVPPRSNKIDSMSPTASNISRTKQTQHIGSSSKSAIASDYLSHEETEIKRDVGIGVRHDDDEDTFLMDVFGTKPIRTKNRVSFTPSTKSSSSSTNRAVHPNRHTYGGEWHSLRDDCVDDLQDLSTQVRRLPVSVPLSTIRTSSLQNIRRIDGNGSDECSIATAAVYDFDDNGYAHDLNETDDESNEIELARTRKLATDRYVSPYAKRTAILKSSSSPSSQTHERSVRFADDIICNDNNDGEESYTPHARRSRKFDVPNLDETVPSTIQERKTYIKPSVSVKRNFAPTPVSRLNVIPTARSPPPQSSYQATNKPTHLTSPSHDVPATPYSRSLLQQQQHHQSSSSASQPHQLYRVFYSDENFPFGTPYDEKAEPYAKCAEPVAECTEPCAESTQPKDESASPPTIDLADKLPAAVAPSPLLILSPPKKPPGRIYDNLRYLSPENIYRKIYGCYIRCDILEDKIFDAVVKLKDIKKHSVRNEANLIDTSVASSSAPASSTSTSGRTIDPIASSVVAVASSPVVVASTAGTIGNNSNMVGRAVNIVACNERKIRPINVRSPMPKFIVTKVTEKEMSTSKETVKFDIRNELNVVRSEKLPYDSLKTARKLMRKEISDAHLMVQLQRRKSLRIFNSKNDDTDATDSEADDLIDVIEYEDSEDGVDSDPNRWRSKRVDINGTDTHMQSTPKTKNSVESAGPIVTKPKTNNKKVEIKAKYILHRSTLLCAMDKDAQEKQMAAEELRSKTNAKKNSVCFTMAETTDFESEYEINGVQQRRKSQRQRQRQKTIAAVESEPERSHSFIKSATTRRPYVTDFDTDTDCEAFYGAKGPTRQRKPNKKYETQQSVKGLKNPPKSEVIKQKPPPASTTPNKPRRQYKPRKPKLPEKPKNTPTKAETSRKSSGRSKRTSAAKPNTSPPFDVVDEVKNATACEPLPSIYDFAPLAQLPNFNLVPYKKSCIGKSKSDVSTKIRTQDMLYTTAAKALRRYSCFVSSQAPIDLLRRVISQRETLFASERKSANQRGKRKGRGRRSASANKKRPNFTKKLLDSADFSSLIDIAQLNEINVNHAARDDDDDSGSDVGDIEQQLSVIRRGQHLGSLQTMSSPLAHLKLLKARRTTDLARKPKTEKRKLVEQIITCAPKPNLQHVNILTTTAPVAEINNYIPCTSTPSELTKLKTRSIERASKSRQPTSLSTANVSDTNTVSSSNTLGEKTEDLLAYEPKAKSDSCEAELVVEHVYDDDDIASPAYEPHVSNSCGENFQENVDYGAQQLSKTRVRTKRTRGRIRWSKPRKRPPIKYQQSPVADTAKISTSTTDITTSTSPKLNIDVVDANNGRSTLPPKILNSFQLQKIVAPAASRRGRKRKMDNQIAPMLTVKSVVQKRARYPRHEITKTVSLSIEPVNFQ